MEFFKAIFIHIIIPIFGILIYLKTCRDMYVKSIPNPPYIQLLLLFFGFGGWLLIFLTLRFGYWSGMASLGFFFLLIVMPIIIAVCAVTLYSQGKLSNFHNYIFFGCLAFLLMELGNWTFFLFASKP
jgi:hypothetical protein